MNSNAGTMDVHGERYRIITKLESGGMADIYLGVQLGEHAFERLVVIKKIPARGQNTQQAMSMFLNEARVVASLNHPHIVKIYDLSRVKNSVCITMEYVDGENFSFILNWLRKYSHSLPLPIILRLMVQACEALHYAHNARSPDGKKLNIIHRDIDPRNLMIDAHGYLKIIDFGVAKAATQTEFTAPSLFKGKLAYISPETFNRPTVDFRADIYALGLVFYQVTTGVKPFVFRSDVNLGEVINRVCHEEIKRPSELNPALPPEMDALIGRAIEKDRDKRVATAEQFAELIRDFGNAGPGIASTDEVKKWYSSEFEKRIAQRRQFEQKVMKKARAMAEHETSAPSVVAKMNVGAVPRQQGPETSSISVSSVPSSPVSSFYPPSDSGNASGPPIPGALFGNPQSGSFAPPSGSTSGVVSSVPPGALTSTPAGMIPGNAPGGGLFQYADGSVSAVTGLTGGSLIPVKRRPNPYLIMIVAFLMFAGGAVLIYSLFWRGEGDTGDGPPPSNLFLVSKPKDVEVSVDGKFVGRTGKKGLGIFIQPNEMHTVTMQKDGYQKYEAAVWGRNAGTHQINAVLEKGHEAEVEVAAVSPNESPENDEVEGREEAVPSPVPAETGNPPKRKWGFGRKRVAKPGKKPAEKPPFSPPKVESKEPPPESASQVEKKPEEKPVEKVVDKSPASNPPSTRVEKPKTEKQLYSGNGNWSGAKVASSGCGKCHGRIDWRSKTEKQWQFFFKRRRHRRHAVLEDLFSGGELKRVEQYIISKLTEEEKRGIAGVK